MRRSRSLSVCDVSMPATTRSSAYSKSAVLDPRAQAARGGDRGLVADVGQLGAGQPGGLAGDLRRSRRPCPAACCDVCTPRIALRPATSGGETKTCRSKRPGRSSAGSSLSSRFDAAMTTRSPRGLEAVHLDQQLVERLLALGVVVRAAAGADGVDLVDEDDRRRVACAPRRTGAGCGRRRGRRTSRRSWRPTASRTARRTRWPRPWPAASCRCRAGRAAGCPSGPSRRACVKRSGSVRNSTTSRSSALAWSTPATSSHLTEDAESGLISCGLVLGIIFIVRHRKKTMRAMKAIGPQVRRLFEMWSHRLMCDQVSRAS